MLWRKKSNLLKWQGFWIAIQLPKILHHRYVLTCEDVSRIAQNWERLDAAHLTSLGASKQILFHSQNGNQRENKSNSKGREHRGLWMGKGPVKGTDEPPRNAIQRWAHRGHGWQEFMCTSVMYLECSVLQNKCYKSPRKSQCIKAMQGKFRI
jgi:hypothetical protein